MVEDNYKVFVKELPPSTRVRLEQVKRFLHQGNASVMIGSGFSFNADMDDSVSMKDWNTLAKDIFIRLYSREPEQKDLSFKTPMRLASQLDSMFGRNALDELILSSLPDDRIIPGGVHKAMMRLPWRDVFTTNYDTLLERAAIDSERYYTVVTNKEMLLYKSSPRIVKLHGSFPNIRPFIITEEDFRTYPQKYPEFVNTVRQSMIESVFCLFGFSGDDPNFLQWIGWLRDVMGQSASPAYLITYDKNIHASDVSLMKTRGIDIINLYGIDGVNGYKEALEFCLKFLENSESYKWTGKLSMGLRIDSEEDVRQLVSEMKSVRENYPGWLVLPFSYRGGFQEMDSSFPLLFDAMEKVSDKLKVDFLFELDWRASISLTPKYIDWYVSALEKVTTENLYRTVDNSDSIVTLKLSLLQVYREQLDVEGYERVLNSLQGERLSERQFCFLCYQKAMMKISLLEFNDALAVLDEWKISSSNYRGVIWKSSLLIELNRIQEASRLLEDAGQNLKQSLFSQKLSPILLSCQDAIFNLMRLIRRNLRDRNGLNKPKKNDYGFGEVSNGYLVELRDSEPQQYITQEHDFGIDTCSTSWHSGESGYVRQYSNAYRYLKCYEEFGYPLSMQNVTMNAKEIAIALPELAKYNLEFALCFLIRTNNQKLVKSVVTRKILSQISRNEADAFFDKIFGDNKFFNNDKYVENRIKNTVLQIFPRFATKLSDDRVMSLFEVLIEFYKKSKANIDRKVFSLLYRNVSKENIGIVIDKVFALPIEVNHFNYDLPLPLWGYEEHAISTDSVNAVANGFEDVDQSVQGLAYQRAIKLLKSTICDENRKVLEEHIRLWRVNDSKQEQKRYSFNIVECEDEEQQLRERLYQEDITVFLEGDYVLNGDSTPIHNCEQALDHLRAHYKVISNEKLELCIRKICEVLETNEEKLKKDDSNTFLGGLRQISSSLVKMISDFVVAIDVNGVSKESISRLYEIMKRFRDYNFSCLSSVVKLNQIIKKDRIVIIRGMIDDDLASDNDRISQEAVNAIRVYAEHEVLTSKMLQSVISFIGLSQNHSVCDALLCLKDLLQNSLVEDTKFSSIDAMLLRLNGQMNSRSVPDEYKTDYSYYANLLAGFMESNIEGADQMEGVKAWHNYSADVNNFNDVRLAFEIGRSQKIIFKS